MWVNCNIARPKKLDIGMSNTIISIGGIGLHVELEEIMSDSLWSIFYASENNDMNLEFLIQNSEIMVRIIDLMKHKD